MLKLGQKRPNHRAQIGYTTPKTRAYQQQQVQLGGFLPLLFLPSLLAGATAGTLATGAVKKQTGSGIIDDAQMLYDQAKQGQGLRLAGQGTSLAGGAIYLAGETEGGALDLPGSGLRSNLLHALPKIKKKRISESADRSLLGTAYNVGTERTMGNGVSLAGYGLVGDVVNSHLFSVVKETMKRLGIGDIIPDNLVHSVIKSATNKAGSTIKDVVLSLGKKVLPIITKTGLAMTGNGMHYGKVIQSKKYNKLHGKLAKYFASRVAGQDGGDFFTDFYDGFMSVIRPVAKVLGPIASIVAPEFAGPISAVTGAIENAPQ